MKRKDENEPRYALELSKKALVIDATPEQIKLIKQGKLAIELLKITKDYEIYKVRKWQ